MYDYEVDYQIDAIDGDGPETETVRFQSMSDETARVEAYRIRSRRGEEIRRRGGLANMGTLTVYRLRIVREKL